MLGIGIQDRGTCLFFIRNAHVFFRFGEVIFLMTGLWLY